MEFVLNKTGLTQLKDLLFEEKELKVFVLRLDEGHPFISGNKWYKLKYNLEEFTLQKKEFLVTFGGAYSNHLVATASAGKELCIQTIGIVRGEELNENSNACLTFASSCGMKLIFVSREEYKRLRNNHSLVTRRLAALSSLLFFLPEGGSNELAVKGCEEITRQIAIDFDWLCCACGTGSTLAGMVRTLKGHQQAIGIAVLKGAEFLTQIVKEISASENNFQIMHNYHSGGYAKSTKELDEFCHVFMDRNHLAIEPVYTGKLFFGIYDLVKNDFFEKGKTIVVVHTGGVFDFACADPS